ncbi:hypothetical protein [Lentzea sp. NPDC059081]|uniref:hypothetical protein n=1 Tax=Lentzea sp. NPDC059081 TaxID=3346719 RepID=UPI00367751D0
MHRKQEPVGWHPFADAPACPDHHDGLAGQPLDVRRDREERVMTNENGTPGTPKASRELPRVLAWVLLVLALAVNICVSLFSLPLALGVVSGVIALALAAILVSDHRRKRSRPKP